MIKYMLVRTNMIWKNIKYQIGRTYKKTKNNENFDLNYINSEYTINCDQYKILKIKDNGYCFKILGEINYSEIISNRNTFKMIAAIKNKDEKILEEFVESDDDKLQIVVINAGVHKYLDIYIKNKDDFCIPFFTEDVIFRKKDLDIILSLNRKNDRVIADYGFDEHLDYLSKHSEDEYCLKSILQFHRKCDYDMIKEKKI